MTVAFTDDRVRAARVHAQFLAGPPAAGVAGAVRGVTALQAQDARAARLSVRARTSGLTVDDVRRAVAVERSVIHTWAMRGTLHFLPAADAGWIVDLLGPVVVPRFRRRRSQLGLDEDACLRAAAAMRDILAGGRALTRAGLIAEVNDAGVEVPQSGQAPAHLVLYAAMNGVICRGPETDEGEPTYVLLREWVGTWEVRDVDSALAELARRYVVSHGPVTLDDFASWSGLPVRQARRGWELVSSELVDVGTDAGRAWVAREIADALPEPFAVPSVRLLGAFDAYLIDYRGRDLAVAPEHATRVAPGGGIIHPAVLVDGRAVARWRWGKATRDTTRAVTVEPFGRLDPRWIPALEREVTDVGRFLGIPTCLRVEDP